MASLAEFMDAAAASFPELPGAVRPVPGGFELVTERSVAGETGSAAGRREERRAFVVTADEATGVYAVAHRRAADLDRDHRERSLTRASRQVDRGRARGRTFSVTFRRTPEGLVRQDRPQDTGAGLARIRAAAAATGWREGASSDGGAPEEAQGAGPGDASAGAGTRLPRWAIVLAIAVPVVILVVGGIVVAGVVGVLLALP